MIVSPLQTLWTLKWLLEKVFSTSTKVLLCCFHTSRVWVCLGQEVRINSRVSQARLWLLSVLKAGVSRALGPVFLIICFSIRDHGKGITMGDYGTMKKTWWHLVTDSFIKELLAPLCLWLDADEKQKDLINHPRNSFFKINWRNNPDCVIWLKTLTHSHYHLQDVYWAVWNEMVIYRTSSFQKILGPPK